MNKWLLPILFIALIFPVAIQAKRLHKERSIYRNVVIVENKNQRCMRFETRRRNLTNQACIDTRDPQKIAFEYIQGILAGYAINPHPKRILILGLGGGVLSNAMHQISPDAEIVNVDIDPVVVKLARKYFDYSENEKVSTEIKDGRVFVKRALLKEQKFDWIVLDAFNGDYIPEHMMTKEFLTEVKDLLSENGFVSANTFSSSRLYDYESVTYQKVFGELQIFQAPTKGNRIIFARKGENFSKFPRFDNALKTRLQPFQFDLDTIWNKISNKIDWDETNDLLTDQYSPANLLKQ